MKRRETLKPQAQTSQAKTQLHGFYTFLSSHCSVGAYSNLSFDLLPGVIHVTLQDPITNRSPSAEQSRLFTPQAKPRQNTSSYSHRREIHLLYSDGVVSDQKGCGNSGCWGFFTPSQIKKSLNCFQVLHKFSSFLLLKFMPYDLDFELVIKDSILIYY